MPIRERLEKIYGDEYLKLNPFQEIIKLGNPKNKSILDLGCGSIKNIDDIYKTRIFEPWLSRALHELEAKVIGIDLHSLDKENFHGYKIDLTKENSLYFLKENSIDIAVASSFFDSPSLKKSTKETFNLLVPQLNRIVKPNGYFIFENLNTNYNNIY